MGYRSDRELKQAKDSDPATQVSGRQLAASGAMELTQDSVNRQDVHLGQTTSAPHTPRTGSSSQQAISSSSQLGVSSSSQLGVNSSSQLGVNSSSQLGVNSSSQLGAGVRSERARCSGVSRCQRSGAERPHSAHLHRECGRLLRLIGDEYLCSSCGKMLQVIGDAMTTEYAIRKALSCTDLKNLDTER